LCMCVYVRMYVFLVYVCLRARACVNVNEGHIQKRAASIRLL